MMIQCSKHGYRCCVGTSVDLADAHLASKPILIAKRITFTCLDQSWRCYVTPEFLERNRISLVEGQIELEDQPWLNQLAGICDLCFSAALNTGQIAEV
jgi:hypothetical protein